MIIEIVLGRPVLAFTRGEDVPVSESKNMTRQILLDLHPFGYEPLISVDKFIRGFNQVFSDLALGDQIYDGEEQEGLVRCVMVSNLRIPVPALVGPEISEHLEVFLKHCLGPHRVFLRQLETQ